MVAELVASLVLVLALVAEILHARRCRRVAPLAFGPTRTPASWVHAVPFLRVFSLVSLCWGLVVLMLVAPRVHEVEETEETEERHLLLVLDVSPSMRLQDAGPEGDQSRMQRASAILESFFRRIPIRQYLLSVVAVYNGAKPVVVDTRDVDVVRNIMDDLPMHYAFRAGKTNLFSGLEEAARIARPWQPRSTTLVLLTDGDTVPGTGMPVLPASVANTLVIGVGDPRTGTFINGRQSRQDTSTLRQIAHRLNGTFHNGNKLHLGSDLVAELTLGTTRSKVEKLTRREYALIACGLGGMIFALLPIILHFAGTRWRPGVPESRIRLAGGVKTAPKI